MKKPSTDILFRLGFQSPNSAALILVRFSFSFLFSVGSITGALEVLLQHQEQHIAIMHFQSEHLKITSLMKKYITNSLATEKLFLHSVGKVPIPQ